MNSSPGLARSRNPGQLLNYDKHFPGKRIAFVYESGPTGFRLHDDLGAQNRTCLVVESSMVAIAPGNRVKTNRLDSKNLSVQLRGGVAARWRIEVV